MSNLRSPVKRKKDCGEIQETFPIIGPVLIRCVEGTGFKMYDIFRFKKAGRVWCGSARETH